MKGRQLEQAMNLETATAEWGERCVTAVRQASKKAARLTGDRFILSAAILRT
jgi:hypothetical protein